VVVSIAGSFKDTLVRSDLASLETIVPKSHSLSLLTTSVPDVRLQSDHLVGLTSLLPFKTDYVISRSLLIWKMSSHLFAMLL